ncbi:TPA: NUDIX domain-containing protein [Staphylococcus pseudintermedius]|nr:NUDIX domain-containing protein [Staphylococcus pseudintermedius]HBI7147906.1 NUDIX domain-containing protein [Staphylococcus pseudintermedius]
MTEILNIYFKNKQYKGTMNRADVHKYSEWHETFQCIFTTKEYILLQERSALLSDYPGLLDVTVGGHIQSDENISDGTREIKEEMGLNIDFNRLEFLCTIPESINDKFIDNEFINIYTLELEDTELNNIPFNDGEVTELYKIKKTDFFLFSTNSIVNVKGTGLFNKKNKLFSIDNFLPYSKTYFVCISSLLQRNLISSNNHVT